MRKKYHLPKPDDPDLKPDKDGSNPSGTMVYLKDDWVRAVGIPVFGITIPLVTGLFGHYTYRDAQVWLGFFYFIFLSFLVWQGNRYMLFRLRSYYSWFARPLMKTFLLVFTNIYFTVPLTVLMLVFWYLYSGLPAIDWEAVKMVSLINVICVLFVTHVYETVFLIKERESDLVQMERLERTKAQAELEALKYQIDPHFMFNSLNTLSHLIEQEPAKASQFNEKLAEVYRYILTNKDRNLVFLEEELAFLNDYFQLFEIRFGTALKLDLRVLKGQTEKWLIPPISLQVLLENVVKHNAFSQDQPMTVHVELDGAFLHMTNEVRPKEGVKGTGIGLTNLSERYELLAGQKPVIEQVDGQFWVKLSLLSA